MGSTGLGIVFLGPYVVVVLLLYLQWESSRRTERWSDALLRFVDVLSSLKTLVEGALKDDQADADRLYVCYEQIRASLQDILMEVKVLGKSQGRE